MIVHIFDPGAKFTAVRYNTDKVDNGKGELMKVSGFGPLQIFNEVRPEDYRNYLELLSAGNKNVKLPQFHAVISAKGKEHDAYTLTEIATAWLDSMGYGRQPYLIVFHKDTSNHHVHMVTTRVDRAGKKIDSNFEHINAVRRLNKIIGLDEGETVKQDIAKALAYRFSTKAQFIMILESQGYVLKETAGRFEVIKFGHKLAEVPLDKVTERIADYAPNKKQIQQLRAIITKYSKQKDVTPQIKTIPLPGGLSKPGKTYTSELAEYLSKRLGILFIFHADQGKPPYGYTVIDHKNKAVFKGSEILALKALLSRNPSDLRKGPNEKRVQGDKPERKKASLNPATPEQKDYYSALLKAALHNYPDLAQGLRHQGLRVDKAGSFYHLTDETGTAIPIDELLSAEDRTYFAEAYGQYAEVSEELYRQLDYIPPVSIAEDIDDEQINGRNRRRKKKARTNTR
ncbi:Relaxase/Mobilisation nuclease domain-containing protein [Mucilaginibacter pineti]|uniref:Relaxase/Mobilisation nuclease domain-containing protein n=1 Tax=Mucilaginibacter pineti TaxID=1391627 RepID=A0A1G7JQ19_9SPHI|nr:relaxase/mobilization nuclease domain-containing protein [Mucilaginibacter pineti]SDF27058.1 Relaxase/Mobilisation nuclease domain-containing protein [Mucilaginibacter pineti]